MSVQALLASMAFAAAVAAAPAKAVPDCVTIEVNPVATLCQGQSATLGVSMKNGCSGSKRVALTFALDKETIREKAEVVIDPLETIDKEVFLPLPATIASGRHTVTVHLRDAAGNVASTDLDVVVDRCGVR